jgi:hypothetical protein
MHRLPSAPSGRCARPPAAAAAASAAGVACLGVHVPWSHRHGQHACLVCLIAGPCAHAICHCPQGATAALQPASLVVCVHLRMTLGYSQTTVASPCNPEWCCHCKCRHMDSTYGMLWCGLYGVPIPLCSSVDAELDVCKVPGRVGATLGSTGVARLSGVLLLTDGGFPITTPCSAANADRYLSPIARTESHDELHGC